MTIHGIHVKSAVVYVGIALILGAVWIAFGQNPETFTELPSGMRTPNIRDLKLIEEVENLSARVDSLESTVTKLDGELSATREELNLIKKASTAKP